MITALTLATILILVVSVAVLITREHYREVHVWDDYLAAVRADAINEAAWDEAVALGNSHETTPVFDQVIDQHPWVAEQLLAHELSDDDAVARWLR